MRPSSEFARSARRRVTVVVAAAAGLAACGSTSEPSAAEPFPAVQLTAAGDASPGVDTASWIGEPLVINFWYSTCAPCTKELADFAPVHDERVTFRPASGRVQVVAADLARLLDDAGATA